MKDISLSHYGNEFGGDPNGEFLYGHGSEFPMDCWICAEEHHQNELDKPQSERRTQTKLTGEIVVHAYYDEDDFDIDSINCDVCLKHYTNN
tara:strand:+ start:467 stop:739 length:273 start_codon:yes stop_codon:yes gene_type:complete